MHTIEASVLVPLGLGLIGLLLLLTFYLHDQTVLAAEYSTFVLEWQSCPGKWDEGECLEEAKRWGERLLITDVHPVKLTAGNNFCSLQVREDYRLFNGIFNMMEQSFQSGREKESKAFVKVNPCWVKRIWKVVEGG